MDKTEDPNINVNDYKRPKVFRRYDDGYIVREMLKDDGRIVQNWYCGMGKISPYDLNVCFEVFPPGAGFYVGEKDGSVVASAIRIPWSENLFYGSLYYVSDSYRRRGYGTRLRDQVAREYVDENMLIIDAVEGKVAETNTAKFGYVPAPFTTVRYEGDAVKSCGRENNKVKIVKTSEVPFDNIISYDNKCFVVANNPIRKAFLEKWFRVEGGVAYVALDERGHITGYGQRRPCFHEKNHQIGPLYADSTDVAEALLARLCTDVAGERVTVTVYSTNDGMKQIMKRFGFDEVFRCVRMYINGDPKDLKETTFAITSLDVCGF